MTTATLLAPTVSLVFTVAAPPDAERMLYAIAQVEAASPRQRGKSGEWGTYQLLPVVWRKHSTQLQWNASPEEQKRVALAHLADIRKQLRAAGFPDTPWFVGASWNGGVTATIKRILPSRARDYADRMVNLYSASGR